MSLDGMNKNIKKFNHDNKHSKVMRGVFFEAYVISVRFPNQRHKISRC